MKRVWYCALLILLIGGCGGGGGGGGGGTPFALTAGIASPTEPLQPSSVTPPPNLPTSEATAATLPSTSSQISGAASSSNAGSSSQAGGPIAQPLPIMVPTSPLSQIVVDVSYEPKKVDITMVESQTLSQQLITLEGHIFRPISLSGYYAYIDVDRLDLLWSKLDHFQVFFDGQYFKFYLQPNPFLLAGTYTGNFRLRLCKDEACVNEVAVRDDGLIPYEIKVEPPNTFSLWIDDVEIKNPPISYAEARPISVRSGAKIRLLAQRRVSYSLGFSGANTRNEFSDDLTWSGNLIKGSPNQSAHLSVTAYLLHDPSSSIKFNSSASFIFNVID